MINVNDDILHDRLSNIQDTINAIESCARVLTEYEFIGATDVDAENILKSLRDLTKSLAAQTSVVKKQA